MWRSARFEHYSLSRLYGWHLASDFGKAIALTDGKIWGAGWQGPSDRLDGLGVAGMASDKARGSLHVTRETTGRYAGLFVLALSKVLALS